MNNQELSNKLLEMATEIQNTSKDVKFITFAYLNDEIVAYGIEYK